MSINVCSIAISYIDEITFMLKSTINKLPFVKRDTRTSRVREALNCVSQ